MAVGDVTNQITLVATGAYLDIQPSTGVEWVIHNIYHEADVELYYHDTENSYNLLFATDTAGGVFADFFFHCTNEHRIRVKNTNASSKLIAYDGVITGE